MTNPADWYLKMHLFEVIEYSIDIDFIFLWYSAMFKDLKN